MFDVVDYYCVGLVFYGVGYDCGVMGWVIGVYVVIGYDDQFCIQLVEGLCVFWEFDVEVYQQVDLDVVLQGGGVVVVRCEDVVVGGLQVGFVVFQGDVVGSDQQGGVVIVVGVCFGDVDCY